MNETTLYDKLSKRLDDMQSGINERFDSIDKQLVLIRKLLNTPQMSRPPLELVQQNESYFNKVNQ